MIIRNFDDLTTHLSQMGTRIRLAVVMAEDSSTQEAIAQALETGIVDVTFVASNSVKQNQRIMKHLEQVNFLDAETPEEACSVAVALVRSSKADVLMKGLVNTDKLLRAILNKETGILPPGKVLTHITAAKLADYDKLLFFTDPAVIPYPTIDQRRAQLDYLQRMLLAFGITEPRIALIHCTEKVNGKTFPVTEDYTALVEENRNGRWHPCIVDGPLDLKTSICRESMLTKGIQSPIDGQADAVVFPDIQAGNVFFKTITFLPTTKIACCLQGTDAPVVLTSRSDSTETKFLSIALAALNSLHP